MVEVENITFELNQLPKRIKVDNGSEFISKVLDKWAMKIKYNWTSHVPESLQITLLSKVLIDLLGMNI